MGEISYLPKKNKYMKKYISIILLSLFAVVGSAAQNVVSISSGQGVPGDVVAVDVALQNSDEVTAVEVVVPLVDRQLTYVDGSCVINSERANGHQLNAAVVDGALRIYLYNISLAPLKGNEGQVVSFNLKLGKSPAEYPLQPRVVLSDAAGKALLASVTNGAVTILAPQIEVVTQSVDFGHVPIMAQYTKTLTLRNSGTLPLEVTGVEFSASEFSATENSFIIAVGATKSISVAYSPTKRGAIEESVSIISNAVNGKATATLIADPYSVNELHSSRAEGIAGEEVTVELRMNNMEPIVGLQTMFTLPAGVEYVDGCFAPTERASSHTAMASVNDKQLTLILYSSKNTPMDGNDGVVATFRLRLDCNSGSYKITPQNTVLSNATVENMVSAVSGNYIVVKSPNISGNKELDFGKTPVTEIAKADYSIKNNGKATLVINSVAFLSTGYRVANGLPLSIEPGATGVLNVEFTPTTEGEHSTTMNIYSNDPDEKLKTVKLSGTVYEPNSLTFAGENLLNGNYVVSIGLDNYTGIVAVQMDIHFMPGMTTSNDYLKVTQRLAGHSCSVTKIDEDTYRFIAFSFNNNSIAGNEGKLFDLTFVPNSGVVYKDAPIVIDNVILSSADASNYTSQLSLNTTAAYSHYYVCFVCDGEVVTENFQRAGTAIVQPQMPERIGYTFAGWKDVPEQSPAEDVVYTGEYNVNKYKLDYLVNGVVFATDSIAYGSVITLIEAPVREGHTFSGWSEAPATMPANDVELRAVFIPTEVTITIGQYGSTVYCSEYALDFSDVAGLKAYAATGYNTMSGVISMSRISTAKSKMGVYLIGAPGEYVVPVIERSYDNSLNMLVGVLQKSVVNASSDDGLYANFKYTIKSGDAAPKFYRYSDGSSISAGKAYLQLPVDWLADESSRSIGIRFDDEATDIDEVEGQGEMVKTVYDLQGRVVKNPTKGIYIIEGKKVFISR